MGRRKVSENLVIAPRKAINFFEPGNRPPKPVPSATSESSPTRAKYINKTIDYISNINLVGRSIVKKSQPPIGPMINSSKPVLGEFGKGNLGLSMVNCDFTPLDNIKGIRYPKGRTGLIKIQHKVLPDEEYL
jgi:hypothetical protein